MRWVSRSRGENHWTVARQSIRLAAGGLYHLFASLNNKWAPVALPIETETEYNVITSVLLAELLSLNSHLAVHDVKHVQNSDYCRIIWVYRIFFSSSRQTFDIARAELSFRTLSTRSDEMCHKQYFMVFTFSAKHALLRPLLVSFHFEWNFVGDIVRHYAVWPNWEAFLPPINCCIGHSASKRERHILICFWIMFFDFDFVRPWMCQHKWPHLQESFSLGESIR